jgi:hypothetical protein
MQAAVFGASLPQDKGAQELGCFSLSIRFSKDLAFGK